MKRNRILVLAVLLSLVLVVSSLAPALAQTQSLVIWADGERAPLLVELGEQFTEEFGIPVEVLEIGLGEARDDLLNFGPAGEGPDILISPHDSIGQFVINGAIVPLDLAGLEDQFNPIALDLFTYEDGNLYAVPYATENVALIRNVDLVPEVPETWEALREMAIQMVEDGVTQYPFVVQTGNTYHNFPITSAFGGYIFGLNEDGTYNVSDIGLNSPGGLASAEWLSSMYNDGLMPTDVDDDVAFDLFTSGDAAMIVTGPWFSQRIIDTGVNYSIDPFPVSEIYTDGGPFLGGQGFVISAFSENQILAETFLLDFVATTEFMQAIFDNGGRPSAWLDVDMSANPNIDGFNNAGANAIPMPTIPEMAAVWAASDAALTLISQGADPVQSYEDATQQIAEAIDVLATGAVNSVALVGSLQAAIGCPTDWEPSCETTYLEDQGDGLYAATFMVPAGEYEYKIALNDGWAENYGVDGVADGPNIPLVVEEDMEITFTYDHNTKEITDSVNNG